MSGQASEGLVVGLDWLDLDFFFHHFFEGSVPNFEFRPKMRISDHACASPTPSCASPTPSCAWGPWGAHRAHGGAPAGRMGPLGPPMVPRCAARVREAYCTLVRLCGINRRGPPGTAPPPPQVPEMARFGPFMDLLGPGALPKGSGKPGDHFRRVP